MQNTANAQAAMHCRAANGRGGRQAHIITEAQDIVFQHTYLFSDCMPPL